MQYFLAISIGVVLYGFYKALKNAAKMPEMPEQSPKVQITIYSTKYLSEARDIKKLCDKAEHEQLLSMLN